jgi:predicted dehydrogenase
VTRDIGIGVVGFGWMGQVHGRAYLNLPLHVPSASARPRLVAVSDTEPARRALGKDGYGFAEAVEDWRRVVEHPDVEVVTITAPNPLHQEVAEAAAAAGKHLFCEKPVGKDPAATAAIEHAARKAGVLTGCGYNYRWAPLVAHLHGLIGAGRLGELTHYRGRFFSMYGRDRLGVLSWRFLFDQAGYGTLSDLMCHAVDMAHHLAGPISRVVATSETFIRERPLPQPGGSHYDRGAPGDPTGRVTNEDYVGALVEFAGGSRGVLEADRSMFGPQSEMAFEVHGTRGAAAWDLETMNELRLYLPEETSEEGYIRLLGGPAYPHHGDLVPGGGLSVGFEDLVLIEDLEFLTSLASGEQPRPGFEDALAVANVLAAMARSWSSGTWEPVTSLRIE